MRIAYMCFLPGDYHSGIMERISAMAEAARKLGIDMDYIVLNDIRQEKRGNIVYRKINYSFASRMARNVEQAFCIYKLIMRSADLSPYDVVVLRYPSVHDLACRKFYRVFGNKIITEHHTDEIAELELFGGTNWSFSVKIYLEKKNSALMLSKVAGIVGVTDEIRRIELAKAGAKPSIVIPNGITTERVKFTGFKPFDGKTLTIIFVATHVSPWHGLDRLLEGLNRYEGNVSIIVNLIGDIPLEYRDMVRGNKNPRVRINYCGRVYGEELNSYYSSAMIAVSALALYRKKLREACALKTREYIARGIPFIYAYDDPDISEGCRFALKFDNNDTPIDIQGVIDFIGGIADQKGLSGEMRDFSRKYLDWEVRVRKLYDFAVTVCRK